MNSWMTDWRFVKLQIFLLLVFLLVVSGGGGFFFGKGLIESHLGPEIEKKSVVLGKTILEPIEIGLNLGIPFEKMSGVEDHLQGIMDVNRSIHYILLSDTHGKVLYKKLRHDFEEVKSIEKQVLNAPLKNGFSVRSLSGLQHVQLTIQSKRGVVGLISIGTDHGYLDAYLQRMIIDTIFIVFVALIIGFQILAFLFESKIGFPLTVIGALQNPLEIAFKELSVYSKDEMGHFLRLCQKLNQYLQNLYAEVRDRYSVLEIYNGKSRETQKIGRDLKKIETEIFSASMKTDSMASRVVFKALRVPMFLLSLVESLTISFVPLYSDSVCDGRTSYLAREICVALPLVAFAFLCGAAGFLVLILQRYANKHLIFLSAVFLMVLGLIGASLSSTVWDLTLWRGVNGLGYGMLFNLYAMIVLEKISGEMRRKNLLLFFIDTHVAILCGAVIGSFLGEGLGLTVSFGVCALCTFVVSLLFIPLNAFSFHIDVSQTENIFRQVRFIFKDRFFMALMFLISIPSRLFFGSFVYFLVPLVLNAFDINLSQIGQSMMGCGMGALVLSLGYPWIKERWYHPRNAFLSICAGTFCLGLSLMPLLFFGEIFRAFVGSVFLSGMSFVLTMMGQISFCPQAGSGTLQEVDPKVLMVVRHFFELLGFCAGPLIMGGLMHFFGYTVPILVIGFSSMFLNLIFIVCVHGRFFSEART